MTKEALLLQLPMSGSALMIFFTRATVGVGWGVSLLLFCMEWVGRGWVHIRGSETVPVISCVGAIGVLL